MAFKRPPQHRVDAPIMFVHPTDTAWDYPRIKAEQEKMRESGADPLMHPVARYHGGWTRYDLDAQATLFGEVVRPRDYLDESKQPVMWKLRRLTQPQWYEIHPRWEKAGRNGERAFEAFKLAAIVGVERVEN